MRELENQELQSIHGGNVFSLLEGAVYGGISGCVIGCAFVPFVPAPAKQVILGIGVLFAGVSALVSPI